MSVTELHPPVPNVPAAAGDGHSVAPATASGVVIERVGSPLPDPRTFSLELPDGTPAPEASVIALDGGGPGPSPTADPDGDAERSSGPPMRPAAVRPPLPSYAVALIGGLALTCLALVVALGTALHDRSAPVQVAVVPAATTEQAPSTDPPRPAPATPASAPTAFPASPTPLPVSMITALEAAGAQPLEVELDQLLAAIQHGFGTRSAQLEPTLRSYTYRMASRFEWNPGSFRIAVTAPTEDLAAARQALLERLFEDAVSAGRLQVAAGRGPHALTLVTE